MAKIRRKSKIVNEETLLVTIDIGKKTNYGYCRCPDGTEMMPFSFGNNIEGFRRLCQAIRKMQAQKQLSYVVVGFESTGPYAEPLMHFLKSKGIKLVQVNPAHSKKVKEVYDNSPNKTDKKDPQVIADIIELGRSLRVVIPEGAAAELRRLIHARERFLKTRISLVNRLYDLVYVLFPEFGQIFKDVQTKTAQYLLRHYPTPCQVIACGIDKLGDELRRVSRGRFGYGKAKALYNAAQNSVGITAGSTSIVREIEHIVTMLAQVQQFIAEYEQRLAVALAGIAESEYVLSLKGIGIITVGGIFGEIADFGAFQSIREVEKYAGLNLFEISSGTHHGQRRISKRGRPLLRKLLFYASLNVVRKGGVFHDQYQRYLDRGMIPKKALVAISRKLLRVIFALVTHRSMFDCAYVNNQRLSKAA